MLYKFEEATVAHLIQNATFSSFVQATPTPDVLVSVHQVWNLVLPRRADPDYYISPSVRGTFVGVEYAEV